MIADRFRDEERGPRKLVLLLPQPVRDAQEPTVDVTEQSILISLEGPDTRTLMPKLRFVSNTDFQITLALNQGPKPSPVFVAAGQIVDTATIVIGLVWNPYSGSVDTDVLDYVLYASCQSLYQT